MDCLICGEDAGEQHFCRKCYYKYKDHDTILQLQNCTTAKVIEKYVEGTIYISQDGHKTRSRQEVMIDDFFFTHNIRHVYEKELMIDKDRYGIDHITPDFYLPDKGIYLEHLGFQNNTQYQKENAFKKKIYEDMHKTVIYTYPDDLNNIGSRFEYILTYYQKGSANFFRES